MSIKNNDIQTTGSIELLSLDSNGDFTISTHTEPVDGELRLVKGSERIVRYEASTQTWSDAIIKDDIQIEQVTKLGVTATDTSPSVTDIDIPASVDFKRQSIEVLKFIPGTTTGEAVQTISAFDNADATDFNANDKLVFDGNMRLKTVYQTDMVDNGALGTGKKLFSQVIDKNAFKSIEKIEVL